MAKDKDKTIAYKDLRNSGGGGEIPFVAVHEAQSFNDTQKTQARNNIGAGTGTYSKPSTGIPKSDLASAVQTSLGKADSALQSHQTLKTINSQSIVGSGNITVGGIGDAPSDNCTYVRYQGQWVKDNYITPLINDVYIGYTDGTISPYNESPIPFKRVKGVVLKTDNVCICIHPTEGSGKWASYASYIEGATLSSNLDTAKQDYRGKSNTEAVVVSGDAGSAFTFATALGSEWYLPACGEMEQIRLNAANINTAMSKIGGTALNFGSKYYWSSTQGGNSEAWYWYYISSGGGGYWRVDKYDNYSCRAVCTF